MLDSIFGHDKYLGEIIWVAGNGSKRRNGPGITHQTIMIYTKTSEYIWNSKDPCMREPFADNSLKMHFNKDDGDGRLYRERVVNGKSYKYYADEGRSIGSVWTDCPSMSANTPFSSESTGYPTQKPIKLLDRIIRVSSNPESTVLDPFCGSGTTLVAATQCDRKSIGFDIGQLAIDTINKRMNSIGIQLNG
jgi:site-specific DNA-methyltransferase (adenine-specific)